MDFPSYFKHSSSPIPQSNTPTLVSETRGLKTLARKIPSQRWEFNFSGFTLGYNCATGENETLKFQGEFASLAQGGFNIFDYKPNDMFLINDALTIKLEETIPAKEDYFIISVSPKPESASSIIGKMFRFSTETKVYMITSSTLFGSTVDTGFYRVKINTGSRFSQNEDTNIISGPTMRIKLRLDGTIVKGTSPNPKFNKTMYQFRMVEVI